jgi:hypothetical protein
LDAGINHNGADRPDLIALSQESEAGNLARGFCDDPEATRSIEHASDATSAGLHRPKLRRETMPLVDDLEPFITNAPTILEVIGSDWPNTHLHHSNPPLLQHN